jgi:predicted nucleic acid-binding protein
MVFWDTSALLKLYVAEPDSSAFATLAQSEEPLAISAWTTHEILCGLHRKELLHGLKTGGAEAIYQRILQQIAAGALHVIAYTAAVAQRTNEVIRGCYSAGTPVAIRSLDALQLGSALVGGAIELVSADARMQAGAKIFNLRVLPAVRS